jgi:sec-independent protein translocase protein TatC
VIVGAFVVAAVFTPPDVISQLMMAIPLCLLFELGLLLARFVSKRKLRRTAQLAAAAPSSAAADWTPMSAEETDQAIKELGHRQGGDQKPDA